MTKNPVVNALGALGYIVLVVTVMTLGTQPLRDTPDTLFAPIAALTVFTLSAAVMVFIFFYQPVQLFVEGKKKQAIDLFVKTVGVFAALTVIVLALLFARVI